MYVVHDESTDLFLCSRFGGRDARAFALGRLENVPLLGWNDATRLGRMAEAACPGHRFAVLSHDDARRLPRAAFRESAVFPDTLSENDLSGFLYTQNGGTWPQVGVIAGRMYILKRGREPNRGGGSNVAHVRNEAAADAFCRRAGLRVPASRVYEIGDDVVRLSEYVSGAESLASAWAQGDATLRRRLREQLRTAYPIELLLANVDVFQGDNILVDATGVAWFVDNGATFAYRAMGGLKNRAGGFSYDYDRRENPESPVWGWTSLAERANVPDGVFFDFDRRAVLAETAKYDLSALVAALDNVRRTPALVAFAAAMDAAANGAAAQAPDAPLTSAEGAQIVRAQKALFNAAKTINKHIDKKDYRPELQRFAALDRVRVLFESLRDRAPNMEIYLKRLDEIDASRASGWRMRIGDVPRFSV